MKDEHKLLICVAAGTTKSCKRCLHGKPHEELCKCSSVSLTCNRWTIRSKCVTSDKAGEEPIK